MLSLCSISWCLNCCCCNCVVNCLRNLIFLRRSLPSQNLFRWIYCVARLHASSIWWTKSNKHVAKNTAILIEENTCLQKLKFICNKTLLFHAIFSDCNWIPFTTICPFGVCTFGLCSNISQNVKHDEHMCSEHVEAWNKLIVKQKFCAWIWLITEIKILR